MSCQIIIVVLKIVKPEGKTGLCKSGHDLRHIQDVLISWFVIILALLGVVSLFVRCMIHCKHVR